MKTRTLKTSNRTSPSKGTKRATQRRPGGLTQAVHETVKDMYSAGVVDTTTMKKFDALCLPPVPNYTPRQIRQLRARCNASQAVFAQCLNVTVSSLQKWEIGAKKPSGVARKLLSLVDRDGLEILLV